VRDASGSEENGTREIRFAVRFKTGNRHAVIFSYEKVDGFSAPRSMEAKVTADL
jgi:hypothetical protein